MIRDKLRNFFQIKGKEEKQKELEEILAKVIQHFSDIEPREIKITYNPSLLEYKESGLVTVTIAGYASIDKVCNNKTPGIKAEIATNPNFFYLDNQEKEAIISHELGHYSHIDIEFDKISKEEQIQYQIIADNRAIGLGYGPALLKIFKKRIKDSGSWGFTLIPRSQPDLQELQARIKNLEQRMIGYNA